MQIALIAVLILCTTFSLIFMSRQIILALYKGRTQGVHGVTRAADPITYWTQIAFFTVFAMASLGICARGLYTIVHVAN